jgi:tetratricopeptide (TPR) repeat protein
MRAQAEALLADLALLARLEQIRLEVVVENGAFFFAARDPAYAAAFREYGIDVEALDPEAAGSLLRGRPIAAHVAAALDDWADVRGKKDRPGQLTLLTAAQATDPEPNGWGAALRAALVRGGEMGRKELKDCAARAAEMEQPPATLALLGRHLLHLHFAFSDPEEVRLAVLALRAGQRRHPADFWLNHDLALALTRLQPPELDEAIGHYRAALALRPESPGVHLNLGRALEAKGRLDEAIAEYQEALRLDPDYAEAHNSLGGPLHDKGRPDEAIAEWRAALGCKRYFAGAYMAHRNLGVALYHKGQLDEAIVELRAALQLKKDYPNAHNDLGLALQAKGRLDEAIAEYKEALRLQPDDPKFHANLAHALDAKGQLDEAIAEYKEAFRLQPDDPEAHTNLGLALHTKGRLDEAIAEFHEALGSKRDFAEAYKAHYGLAHALDDKGQLDAAIAEYRAALLLKKDYPEAHYALAIALRAKGQLDEAITEYKEALLLKKDYPEAHTNLGRVLHDKGRTDEAIAEYREALASRQPFPEAYVAHYALGIALRAKGQLDEAIAEYKEALLLKKDYPEAHTNLGRVLYDKGRTEEAIAEYREALASKQPFPEAYVAHNNLGNALQAKGRLDEAIAEFHEALRLKKDFALAHTNLGNALRAKGRLDEAIAEFHEALRLKGDYAEAHCNLGHVLRDKGLFAEALKCLRRGHELGSKDPRWPYPSLQWVKQCDQMVELEARLPAVLTGEVKPRDVGERLTLAWMCQLPCKALYAAAARFFGEAFADDPKLAEDVRAAHRYNAACAAALAGCGQGQDAGRLSGKERAGLRRQALDWLRADLQAWQSLLEKGPHTNCPVVVRQLAHWLEDTDFNGVRGEKALAGLPEAERADWQKLWQEVEALRQQAAGPPGKAAAARP